MSVACIPLDARPVCYDHLERLARSFRLPVALPPMGMLGALKRPADLPALQDWMRSVVRESGELSWILALDTLVYGGLIPSRLGNEFLEELESRFETALGILGAPPKAFSSILRIPRYNGAEEEPEYWAEYGERLYAYSEALHEKGEADAAGIPEGVLQDFRGRRDRNFAMNRFYLDQLGRGRLERLVYCQDDTGAYGLNVQEAQALAQGIEAAGLQGRAHVQTGADEVALTMLARLLVETTGDTPRIFPVYSSPEGARAMARYDGLPIQRVVERQLSACGAVLAEDSRQADLMLLVHTPSQVQGDFCMGIESDRSPGQLTTAMDCLRQALQRNQAVVLADLAYANGADPFLVTRMLAEQYPLETLYGFAGWNTPGNTLGSALSMGVVRWLAERQQSFDAEAFDKLLYIRFADDWLYQSNARQGLRRQFPGELPSQAALTEAMGPGLALLRERLPFEGPEAQASFPCQRTFEVAIQL